jgi:lactoylglutathione lyase
MSHSTGSASEFLKVTPNLVVDDIDASTAFYRDALGFSVVTTVPEEAPFAFVWLRRGGVEVFLNDAKGVGELDPALAARARGGSFTMYVLVTGVDDLYAHVTARAKVVEPIHTQPYGMREFVVQDPDGYLITFASEQR